MIESTTVPIPFLIARLDLHLGDVTEFTHARLGHPMDSVRLEFKRGKLRMALPAVEIFSNHDTAYALEVSDAHPLPLDERG